jgi:nucleoid-associated protein YgaU
MLDALAECSQPEATRMGLHSFILSRPDKIYQGQVLRIPPAA